MTGKITSQGDQTTGAEAARQKFNLDGSDVKIGIISTSFDALGGASSDVANGDLPIVQVLKDLPSDSVLADDEGRALAQIVHDVAPGSDLLFHTVFEQNGETFADASTGFINAVNSLAEAGADIIFDDTSFPTSIFQDGKAAQAVSDITKQGITYLSAAGNNGSISYESPYKTDGTTFSIAGTTFEAFNFGTQESPDLFEDIKLTGEQARIAPLLTWDEPNGEDQANLELFLLNSPELPIDGSNILNIGLPPSLDTADSSLRTLSYELEDSQPVYFLIGREIDGSAPPNEVKWSSIANGADRTAQYEYTNSTETIFGHPNSPDVITVGAADFNLGLPQARTYSSASSSPILFSPDGDRLTCPEIREKPDVFGPDGVNTAFEEPSPFNLFNGTSAAVPHVAGIVALMKQAAGDSEDLTPEQIKNILNKTSLDLVHESETMGTAGFVQADDAIALQTMCFPQSSRLLEGSSLLPEFSHNLELVSVAI
jgi:subtilisin family serine protease